MEGDCPPPYLAGRFICRVSESSGEQRENIYLNAESVVLDQGGSLLSELISTIIKMWVKFVSFFGVSSSLVRPLL